MTINHIQLLNSKLKFFIKVTNRDSFLFSTFQNDPLQKTGKGFEAIKMV